MAAAGAAEEAARAWARPLSETARKVLGLEEFATLPLDEAVERVTRRDAPARALPAQVAAADARRRYARRGPASGGDRR